MTQIAKVAVAAATYAIDKPYDYLVPSGMELSVGCRVTVPFGRGNRTAEGMVLQLRQEVPAKPLKAIRSLLDQESVLSEKEIRLALWMRQRYFCTFYDALHTILPAAVWYRYREIWSLCPTAEEEGLTEREQAVCRMLSDGPQERETLCTALGEDIPPVLYQMKKKGLVSVETETSRKVKDHMVELASLAAPAQEVLERLERRRRSAPRQYEAAAFLAKCGETTVHDLCYFTGATRQPLRSLEKQGLIALRSREEYRISPREYGVPAEEITLNQQQQEAYDSILRQTETGRAGVTLLQGVTGSGKTLVYIRLAQTLLEQGKSVMILVPEIALTPQMMARFTAYFGRKVALLHSGLRLTERWDQYKRIRRGSSRQLLCPQCGYVPQCPRCSVYLTYHSANRRMMCHYCGHSQPAPDTCPDCGGAMKHIGFGTQKVEEELTRLFPGTELLRMDADTVGEGHEKLLREFQRRRIPILLGTQMVAKGLDFAGVTLVGVLAADLSLYVDHYRAAERTFSLLTQVVGRAGRGEKEGRAVIQTYTPRNDVILAAAEQDYDRFYDDEIRLRRLRRDPPFADHFTLTVTGPEEEPVRRACAQLCAALRQALSQEPYRAMEPEVLGPAPAPVVKLNNRYRYRITVVGQNEKPLRQLLAAYMKAFARRPEHRNMAVHTDCNLMD